MFASKYTYRYPRFLLHHSYKQSSAGHTRPHTSLGVLLHSVSNRSGLVNYPRVQTPQLPSKTLTFRRVTRKYERKSGVSSREYVQSQRGTRPNSSSGRKSHLCLHDDLSSTGDNNKRRLEMVEGVSHVVDRGSSSCGKRVDTEYSTEIPPNHCVSKKSNLIFQRDTPRSSSLPHILESGGKGGNSRLSNVSESHLGPLKDYTHWSPHENVSLLPQSLRQTYTPSPIPRDTTPDHVPPTGSSSYRKLTSYTAHHLPNPPPSGKVPYPLFVFLYLQKQ